MDMKTHIVRAVKYLIWLALLFTLVFALMISTGTSRVGAGEALHELFGSSRGMLMIATIVVLALLYPRFGFTRRRRPGRSEGRSGTDSANAAYERLLAWSPRARGQ